jgi:hypothetical protein
VRRRVVLGVGFSLGVRMDIGVTMVYGAFLLIRRHHVRLFKVIPQGIIAVDDDSFVFLSTRFQTTGRDGGALEAYEARAGKRLGGEAETQTDGPEWMSETVGWGWYA